MDNQRSIKFKITIIWLAILLIGSFWLTVRTSSDPVSMSIMPQVPRQGEPILATFKLNNPSSQPSAISYQFYANGELMKEGATIIAPNASKTYQYAYENPLKMGEQVNFMLKTSSAQGNFEEAISLPSYPPQVLSSFASFASFSTTVMSSMASMTYYQTTFGGDMGPNVGLLSAIVLIGLLIFLELSQPLIRQKTTVILRTLRIRFNTVTWILFMIFMAIVYTKIVMIIAT